MANAFGHGCFDSSQRSDEGGYFYVKVLASRSRITNQTWSACTEKTSTSSSSGGLPSDRSQSYGRECKEARARLEKGIRVVKDEPDFPRCYVQDPYGLIYNLTEYGRFTPSAFSSSILPQRTRKGWGTLHSFSPHILTLSPP